MDFLAIRIVERVGETFTPGGGGRRLYGIHLPNAGGWDAEP